MKAKRHRRKREEWIRVDGEFYDIVANNCHIKSIHGSDTKKSDLSFRSWREMSKSIVGNNPENFLNLLKNNAKNTKKSKKKR